MTNDITVMHFSSGNHSWIAGTFTMRAQLSFTSSCEKGLQWFTILIKWLQQFLGYNSVYVCVSIEGEYFLFS